MDMVNLFIMMRRGIGIGLMSMEGLLMRRVLVTKAGMRTNGGTLSYGKLTKREISMQVII